MANYADIQVATDWLLTIVPSNVSFLSEYTDNNGNKTYSVVLRSGESKVLTNEQYELVKNLDYSGGGGDVPTDLVEMVNDHQDKIYGYDTEVDAPSGDGDWFVVPTNVRTDYDPNYVMVNDYVAFANSDFDKNKYAIQINNKLLSLGKKKIAFVFDFKDYDTSVFSTNVSITTWIEGVSVPSDLEIGVSIINTNDNASLLYGNWSNATINKNQYAILQGTSNNMLLDCPSGVVNGGALWGGTDKVEVHVDGLLDRVTALENKPSGGSNMVYDTTTGVLSGAKDQDGDDVDLTVGTITITF